MTGAVMQCLYTMQDLPGVYSARAFVGWYNGLPAYQDVGKHNPKPTLITYQVTIFHGETVHFPISLVEFAVSNVAKAWAYLQGR